MDAYRITILTETGGHGRGDATGKGGMIGGKRAETKIVTSMVVATGATTDTNSMIAGTSGAITGIRIATRCRCIKNNNDREGNRKGNREANSTSSQARGSEIRTAKAGITAAKTAAEALRIAVKR